MATIVNSGSTLTVTMANGLTLTADSLIASGGLLDGAGTITGDFTLLNNGRIEGDDSSGSGAILTIDTGTFTNQGTVEAFTSSVYLAASVDVTNLSNGTLTGGEWDANGDLRLLTGEITTDNANVTILGSFEDFNTSAGTFQPVLNSLTEVGVAGTLELDGQDWVTSGSIVVDGYAGVAASTILAAGGITISAFGTLLDVMTTVIGFPLQVDGTLIADGTLPAGITGSGTLMPSAYGTMELQAGANYTQAIVNNGAISNTNSGGLVTFSGPVSGSGAYYINGGSSAAATSGIELPASVTSGFIGFSNPFGEVLLDSPFTFAGSIGSLYNNDTIVLKGLIANSASLSNVNDTWKLDVENDGSLVVSFTLIPPYRLDGGGFPAEFSTTPDTVDNETTIITSGVSNPCFRAGTRITTTNAEVPVEQLIPGDYVVTQFADEQRIVWIGHRTIDCLRHPCPSKVLPVRVAAHAFGPEQPRRDLFLSPDHAVFIDDVLIPIKYLINNGTITQVTVDTVTYFHVELARHDVLMAEGLMAESYLDTGDRGSFANGCSTMTLFPDFSARAWETLGCAPLVMKGDKVDRLRMALAERARCDEQALASIAA